MTWIIVVLIVLAVLLLAGLLWTATKRKQDQVGRQRADELRSEAAATAADHAQQEARAREVEAEAEQARARADQLDAQAHEERTSYDQSRALEEDHLREADRVDPDVNHRADRDVEHDLEHDLEQGAPDRQPGGDATGYERDFDGAPGRSRTGPPTPPE